MRAAGVLAVCVAVLGAALADEEDRDWWQHATVYQIYPRSFQDSDGDGIGDLQGIINRINYLEELGVTAIWLSPIYPSGGMDGGYDVTDHNSIDPLFGTLDQFKNFTNLLHKKGMRLIMDFIPNHTSNKHKWFQSSRKRDTKYNNYYVWRDTPNNWRSVTGGSAWRKDDVRGQYYLHQFLPSQPDLNLYNPEVLLELKDTLKFWMFHGVDGFRVDAAFALLEDLKFTDETMVHGCTDPEDYACLYHVYTADLDGTFSLLADMRSYLDSWTKLNNVTRFMVTESYTQDWKKIQNYYEYKTDEWKRGEPVAHFPFNFFLVTNTSQYSRATDWAATINQWYRHTPRRVPNWLVGNHDQQRVGSRVGEDKVDGVNMMLLMMEGTVFSYYGEEVGLLDSEVKWEDRVDPQGDGKDPTFFRQHSRDFQRGPLPWDDTPGAGFSSNETTWLPITQDFWELNVKMQNSSTVNATHLNIYRRMARLRKSYVMKHGFCNVTTSSDSDDVLYISRWGADNPSVIGVMNMGTETVTVDLLKDRNSLPANIYLYANSINHNQKDFKLGKKFNSSEITIPPNGAMVFLSQDTSIPLKVDTNHTMIL